MAHRRVLITTSHLEPGDEFHRLLSETGCDVAYSPPQDRQEAADSLVGNDRIAADMIEAGGVLRIIACIRAGSDNGDLDATARRGILACSTPGVSRRRVARACGRFAGRRTRKPLEIGLRQECS